MISASPMTTSSMASLTSSSKRDMCTPFCAGFRSQKHATSAWKSRSSPLWRMRMAFADRVTPARERLIGAAGADCWRSSGRVRRIVLIGELASSVSMCGPTMMTYAAPSGPCPGPV